MNFKETVEVINCSKTIALIPHISPDGDCIGSSLAFALALRQNGKEAFVYMEDKIPENLSFLPGIDMVKAYNGQEESFDLAIAVDTGDEDRLGQRINIFKKAKDTVNIDHHDTNTFFANHNFVDSKSSSAGEIIYTLLKLMNVKIDSNIATCIYVAVITDTGGFKYSNTTSYTHDIASDLIKKGVNVADVSAKIYDSIPLKKVKLMGYAIGSLEILCEGLVSIVTITEEMLKDSEASEDDCEGIVNIPRNIQGVETAVLLRHKSKNEVKVNLRSNSYVDVSKIAVEFSGGGHKRAAGFVFQGCIEDIKKELIEKIKTQLKN